MTLTANNKLVYEASIAHTLRGVWTASVQVDSGLLQPGQSVTLADGAAKWVGTVLRGSDYGGRGVFALVGGAGNLSNVLPAKWYVAVTIGEILADLARETGERISSTIVTALSRYLVGTFTRAEGPASVVLDAPIEFKMPDGSMWKPKNYQDKFFGPSTLRRGIEQSRNVMTVRLADELGMTKIIDLATRLGIYEKLPRQLAMALGAGETANLGVENRDEVMFLSEDADAALAINGMKGMTCAISAPSPT